MLWSNVQQDDGADCVAQEDHSTAHVANSASLILRDGATLIDEAVRLTIEGVPTRSRSWRTHDGGYAAERSSVRAARAHDTGSLEAMAEAVMRLHSTLMTVGRCYKTDATGDRAALELGASNPCLRVHSVRYSANRRPIASQTSLTRSLTWPSTWSRTTSLRTATNAPALSLRCPS